MRARFGSLPVALSAIALLLLSSGCRPSPPASRAPSRPRTLGGATLALPVQHSAAYREATRRFAQKDFAGALFLLDSLLADPQRTPAEHAFLLRQRAICARPLQAPTRHPAPRRGVTPPLHHSITPSLQHPAPNAQHRPPLSADCGPRALLLLCRQFGIPAALERLKKAAGTTAHGTTLEGLAKAAKACGWKAEGVQMDRNALKRLDDPAIAWVNGNHYLAVLKVEGDRATVHDPNRSQKEVIPTEDLLRRCGGILLRLRAE